MLETIQPSFDRFICHFLLRGIIKQILYMRQCTPQFLQLVVNSLRASNSLHGFISQLLKNDFDEFNSNSFSHCLLQLL
ncbi:hypothetical protein HanXRQr2_Chr13g0614971 [Helianthus annuus]|uniref:Uncharacterized protein n=1 Tax=Helianthus annuus TaxID=4232 RepID=A0A9K3ELV6_HELAN|nr:hypothetical protein HanXRQr2_Chr13g0614971 [Helianthus annuus]